MYSFSQFRYESVEVDSLAEFSFENETFSINLEKILNHEDLQEVNEFACSLTIPNTEYQLEKKVTYYPGKSFYKI